MSLTQTVMDGTISREQWASQIKAQVGASTVCSVGCEVIITDTGVTLTPGVLVVGGDIYVVDEPLTLDHSSTGVVYYIDLSDPSTIKTAAPEQAHGAARVPLAIRESDGHVDPLLIHVASGWGVVHIENRENYRYLPNRYTGLIFNPVLSDVLNVVSGVVTLVRQADRRALTQRVDFEPTLRIWPKGASSRVGYDTLKPMVDQNPNVWAYKNVRSTCVTMPYGVDTHRTHVTMTLWLNSLGGAWIFEPGLPSSVPRPRILTPIQAVLRPLNAYYPHDEPWITVPGVLGTDGVITWQQDLEKASQFYGVAEDADDVQFGFPLQYAELTITADYLSQ